MIMEKFDETMYKIIEPFMLANGKFFSFCMPIMAFFFAGGLAWKTPSLPSWIARGGLCILVLILVFVGIYLLVNRKKLWD